MDFHEGQLRLMKSLSAKLATIRNQRRDWEGGGWDGDGKEEEMTLFFCVFSVFFFSKSRHRFGSAAMALVIHIHFRILQTIVWSTLTRRHWSKKHSRGRHGTERNGELTDQNQNTLRMNHTCCFYCSLSLSISNDPLTRTQTYTIL